MATADSAEDLAQAARSADAGQRIDAAFRLRVAAGDLPPGAPPAEGLSPDRARALFAAQCLSRHLDLVARDLQKRGEGFYTIGSSGHEGMAAVAAALRPSDMAFLHYRDAAFQIARAGQVPGQDPAWDMLLSFTSSCEDPISGGRHKVLGSKALAIPPQTSTIASHLPKAVGAAFSQGLARRARPEHCAMPEDGIVLASFGDASANHSTAQGAINTAGWAAYSGAPMPLLLVCEDNGIGISVPTPRGWIAESLGRRAGLTYMAADGLDLYQTYRVASEAAALVRRTRKPVFLHLRTVRLMGHAGSDLELAYRPRAEIMAAEADDPLLHSVRLLRDAGAATPDEALAIYHETGASLRARAEEAIRRPRLRSADQVAQSLIPPARANARPNGPDPETRARAFGTEAGAMDAPQPMAKLINWALTDLMLTYPEIVLAGEDVGRKGGVYGVTQKLQDRFGQGRVIDTLLDEQAILGLGIGMAQNGFLPIPEIQFLAYLHNAEDQLRGEAATLPFFSNGQYANPMVLRIAGLGYQRGFGGHFHNDNSLAVLRDIPGLILAVPSDGAEAAMMLRECVRLTREEQRLCVMVEPIALYQTRDLVTPGDGLWARGYPDPQARIPYGTVARHGDGRDLAIVTYGNGAYLSAQAVHDLKAQGVDARIVDLRWLAPLPETAIRDALKGCQAVLVVDECRRSGNVSEALMTLLAEAGHARTARLTATDCFIATGPAYAATLPSREGIVAAANALLGRG
ncbi:MFS transporter [Halovulum dunhuangense]|uniref:2-oxoglutarate dehydrogenase E1 component n=1 Tax=Halovulum dunhuangense TaxID=1505036 RepID=A0A849L418_9RHOB|nr:thiamine pyrophosphate-dependent enzyme [Halovulum dunhuangense]NNU81158.1 MFS transporter [Halovulum dunhuangense]